MTSVTILLVDSTQIFTVLLLCLRDFAATRHTYAAWQRCTKKEIGTQRTGITLPLLLWLACAPATHLPHITRINQSQKDIGSSFLVLLEQRDLLLGIQAGTLGAGKGRLPGVGFRVLDAMPEDDSAAAPCQDH